MKILRCMALATVLTIFASGVTTAGFDEFGYNRVARVFVGTGNSWCMGKLGMTLEACTAYMDPYGNDHLVMKWNKEWDRGNQTNWSMPPYKAEENNEWNGAFAGGSGEVWHYKIVWVGNCSTNPDLVPEGGYCIWGQFAVIMDQGTGVDQDGARFHEFLTKAIPAGYGAYYDKTPFP